MDTNDIQKRIDAASRAAIAKGMITPSIEFRLVSEADAVARIFWAKDETSFYQDASHGFKGEHMVAVLDAIDVWIAERPSPQETKLRAFMDRLDEVIDLGRKSGIEVAFVNPLVETMKKLSENALTYQKVAAE